MKDKSRGTYSEDNQIRLNTSEYTIYNTQVDDGHGIDVVMSMSNLIEFTDNYLKTFGMLWQF